MTAPAAQVPGTYRPGPTELAGCTGLSVTLQERWRRIDREQFNGKLRRAGVSVVVGQPTAWHALATTTRYPRTGRLQIVVDADVVTGAHAEVDASAPTEGRWRLIDDLLTHEGTHAVLTVLGRAWHEQADHAGPFAALAAGLGDRFGIPAAPAGGWWCWPQMYRDPEHYLGAYRPLVERHHTETFRGLLAALAE